MPAWMRQAVQGINLIGAASMAAVYLTGHGGFELMLAAVGANSVAWWATRRRHEALLRFHARRTAVRVDDFAELETMAPRTAVVVRGRVRALDTMERISGQLVVAVQQELTLDSPGSLAKPTCRDAACDFILVDTNGHEVLVEVAGAELCFDLPSPRWLEGSERLRAGALAPSDFDASRVTRAAIAETAVRDGADLEVLGVLGRALDTGGPAGYREAPTKPAIRSGQSPLVLFGLS